MFAFKIYALDYYCQYFCILKKVWKVANDMVDLCNVNYSEQYEQFIWHEAK